ncbi:MULTISPECIES: enoyl-CoA hydratase-related protein [unclassified Chelatococcus]|uniref:enoyl-CoA hydratase-related protein n=1 Tax=unclassified Chelatococcus TaxID=2638111 RepID=UPI001BD02114|nr:MULTISPECIES: enoyl-CoA hydratase-related protein [unclassified Chelatococcus]MBS7700224.1 enoyl-CoA hydratase/isomerase family protein [Chelatococcus sp. YT9]MBX3558195.1 enoyl-CoA hydratase/isomerase family protein [Chelatococcus sp.]
MTDEPLLVERDGPIAIVTLNEPRSRNALSGPVVTALLAFLESANTDESLGCIVLTATGEGFCSGGNVKEMRDGSHPMFAGKPHQMQEAYRRHIQRIPKAFHALDVPIVAAVNGAAIGAGMDLACMCDIRLVSPEASFAESFLRVGLVSGDGGAWYLPRLVGFARAIELALTCRMLTADEAVDWGIASRVVPADRLVEEAVAVARQITAFPPKSVRLNKRLIRQSSELGLPESLELAAAFQAIVQSSADQREAVAAILEKRQPNFMGD